MSAHARHAACAIDHQVGCGHLLGAAHPPGGSGEGGSHDCPALGPVDHDHLGGAGLGQRQDHRPGRAAGPDHQATPVLGLESVAMTQRGQKSLSVGIVCPPAGPSVNVTQLTAASRVTAGVARSTRPAIASLWGMVTERPAMPSARIPARAGLGLAGGDRKAHGYPTQPHLGEGRVVQEGRERMVDGSPMTPTTVVAAETRPMSGREGHGSTVSAVVSIWSSRFGGLDLVGGGSGAGPYSSPRWPTGVPVVSPTPQWPAPGPRWWRRTLSRPFPSPRNSARARSMG